MQKVTPQQLLDQLHWRYATHRFDADAVIEPGVWSALKASLVLSPSAFGLQPWGFVHVADRSVRQALCDASWRQEQVVDATHFLVFAIRTIDAAHVDAHVARIATVRRQSRESLEDHRAGIARVVLKKYDQAERDAWAGNQLYLALGNFLACAAMLGVDACPLEGFERHRYDEILELHRQQLRSRVAVAVGHRRADDRLAHLEKVRFPRQQVLLQR